MGCDIHLHTEVKIDGVWHHYSAPSIDRNYSIFAKMAGVRKTEPSPIAQPRGLPADSTFLTRFDYEREAGDAHTPSWLGAKEIEELVDWVDETFPSTSCLDWESMNIGYFFGNSFQGFSKYPSNYTVGMKRKIDDVRWVFWFDN